MSYLILDIETVPDETCAPPIKSVSDESAAAAHSPMPPPFAHEVCAIGCLLLGDDFSPVRLGAIMNKRGPVGEREALVSWSTYMAKIAPTIVTWNGRGFDLPVLLSRCLRLGVPCSWYFGRRYDYRYSDVDHCDLLDQMTGFGAANRSGYKLDAVARAIGLPGKPEGTDGGKVAELAAAGKWDLIQNYCLSDVIQTGFIFLRWKHLRGEIDSHGHNEAAKSLHVASKEIFSSVYPKKTILVPNV